MCAIAGCVAGAIISGILNTKTMVHNRDNYMDRYIPDKYGYHLAQKSDPDDTNSIKPIQKKWSKSMR